MTYTNLLQKKASLAATLTGVFALGVLTLAGSQVAFGQAAAPAPAAPPAPAPQATADRDPFPPANLKNFSAATPTVPTVEAFLHAIWGYDTNRIWRVEAIRATPAAGVAEVTVYAAEKGPNAKVQPVTFFVTPDGKHAIAGGVMDFGEQPFAERRKMMQDRADGAYLGSADKSLELVEFADLQCPHCKDAQPLMQQLAHDFPKARIVYQPFPLMAIHPAAFEAAAQGVCVAKQGNPQFFAYADAVYATQAALTPDDTARTLAAAVAKAGLAPADVAACAATPATKATVNADVQLASDAGIGETPTLVVNGRPLPGLLQIPYETLKNIILFQASLDGVHVDTPQPALTNLAK